MATKPATIFFAKSDDDGFVKIVSEDEYDDEEFVKVTYKSNLSRTKVPFVEGLNEDIHELTEELHSRGGFYFCRAKDVCEWAGFFHHDCNIWRVSLPEGEKVVDFGFALKAKRIIMTDCKPFYANKKLSEQLIRRFPYTLEYMTNQNDAICELAVSIDGTTLEFVKNQTPKICEIAVNQNSAAKQFVKLI